MTQYARGPVRVVLRMEIVPGREAEFEAVWLEIGRIIARQPANRGQVLARDEEQERPVYHVFTDWADEAGFRAFELSPEHVEHRRRLAPLRTGGTMTVTRIVHDLTGRYT
ncbi:antibiotic biosynthesis monooxygenase family protein [Streptomyces griseofuscus]|uniref:Antibiotic biosynthesis monooxygenase n=1 Tax=Streptomyces griseofuscus TaxID=146922 RepID=A0A3R8RIB6_9ACTN|nr:antibiotic biosynthesis monooxygenase family protein [Streptomyces griseofuscus]RRQ88642.1 antibiotic biosynthesis monooxygenase [Streptomyces griseofuscus]